MKTPRPYAAHAADRPWFRKHPRLYLGLWVLFNLAFMGTAAVVPLSDPVSVMLLTGYGLVWFVSVAFWVRLLWGGRRVPGDRKPL